MVVGPSSEKIQARRRLGLFVISCLYTVFYIGAFFGYGPMQLLLEQNNAFSWKCSAEQQSAGEICPAQTSALINVSFFAQISQIVSPLLGQMADQFGAHTVAYLMAASSIVFLSLLTLAAHYHWDRALYIAFGFGALSTWCGGLLSVQTGLFFTGQTRSRVIFVLNSLFDAGSITYLGLWGIAEVSGASLAPIAGGYLGLAVILFGAGTYFWSMAVPVSEESKEADNEPQKKTDEICKDANIPQHGGVADDKALEGSASFVDQVSNDTDADMGMGSDGEYVLVADRSPRKQMISPPFLALSLFWTIHVTSNQFALTTTRDFLAYLGDDELGNRYLTIFTLLLPASLCALPFVDYMIIRFGFVGGFQGVNALALAYGIIRVSSTNLKVQVLGFIFFSFFRSFLFGVFFSFLPTLISGNVVGKATGAMFFITGVTAFINIPLTTLAIETFGGDFFVPNLIYLCLVLPCIAATVYIGRVVETEKLERLRQNTQKDSLR